MLAALVCAGAGAAPAHTPRLAAFTFHCVVPPTDAWHTRAVLVGQVTLANRTDGFVVSCEDGPSTSRFPDILDSDGAVQALDVTAVTVLEDSARQLITYNYCEAHGRNGFLTFHCMASETDGGEVQVLVSIPPPAP
jgi:hypothetical protein